MATNQLSGFIQHLRRVMRGGTGLTDGQLLADYLSRRDEAAIAALVRRHGPMVWGVCRRVLHNHHDAEDAFQTTFLVLVRKAASIASRELLANWLYGVAHQTALKARATAAKRKGRERQATEMPEPAAIQQDPWCDLQPLLDEELSRLPAKYRGVIVLCDLEGKTRKEAAGQLRCPEGTVAGRLARARIMLAKRLTRRGVALSGGVLAAVLSQQAASAVVPTSVAASTIKAASLLAAGKAAATGAISVKVAALTEGVMKAMLFTKLKAVIAVVLILGFVATGATVLTCSTAAGQDDKKPAAEKPVEPAAKQEKEKETFTAWGKEVGGLQAGLGFRPGEHRVYHHREGVAVVLRVRNVGKEAVEFNHIWAFFVENPPAITDADGKVIPLPGYAAEGAQRPRSAKVAPGKEVALYEWGFDLRPQGDSGNKGWLTIQGSGKFSLQCERIVGPTSGNPNHPNPTLDKLATGKLELEVKEKEAEKLPEKKQEKEGFTAWGKEVEGLQAGLGFRPGEKRVHSHGETVKLVVRVRNVGKEEVTFNYIPAYFVDWPPSVTDGDGKTGPQIRFPGKGGDYNQVKVNLAPGKEIELAEVKLELRPASERDNKKENTLYGTGKFQIHYERLMYSSGAVAIASILRALATGKLDLEVKEGEPAKPPQKQEQKQEKEGFTAWGKEVGGLQAGLGYHPGEHRTYHIGETVALVVRVRNVSKEAVKFQYVPQFLMEKPPTVTDGEGKPVHFRYGWIDLSKVHPPVDVNLAPGKEIELYELTFKCRPANESGNEKDTPFYGTGKFQIQYERVFGNSSAGKITLDSALSKLATGKLELEIEPESPAATPDAPEKQGTRQQAARNLSMLIEALHQYHYDPRHGRLPPAVIMGKDGKGGVPHSWRVEILPYLGEKALYDDYRFDEPWDGKHNRALIARMPAVFRSPRDRPASTYASYFALVTPGLQPGAPGSQGGLAGQGGDAAPPNYDHGTIFSSPAGTRLTEIPDGTNNVVALVEARREIPWTRPEDVPYSADKPLPKLGEWFSQGWHAGFADGEAKMLSPDNDETTIRRLFMIGDGYPTKPKFVP